MKRILITLVAIVALAVVAFHEGRGLTIELVAPPREEPISAPVKLLAWRMNGSADSVTYSFRADQRDLAPFLARRGREFLAVLPDSLALGPGTHRLSADVCAPAGPCASSEVTLEVLPPGLRPADAAQTKRLLLKALYDFLWSLLERR
jgi:hypothetical protein